ncbi:hypothetical protein [Sphingorhabdus lacus]|uniref:hypothetical protein n=1 Tax=Sphingorhabdus lacus TaxID=392610 RepID=UPI003593C0DC
MNAHKQIWTLWDFMEQLAVEDILSALPMLASYGTKWSQAGLAEKQELFPDTFDLIYQSVERLQRALSDLDAPISLRATTGLLSSFDASIVSENGGRVFVGQNLATTMFCMTQIGNSLHIELGQRFFIKLRGANKELYDQEYGLFGEEVDDAFPDAIADISEAGKCLALERWTATVFHLMRAMEVGVATLADKLQATVLNKHGETLPWGILTGNIGDKIKLMPDGSVKDDWQVMHTLLHSANRAYRTKTAHPKKTYDEKEAAAAFQATKSFTQAMAERMGS